MTVINSTLISSRTRPSRNTPREQVRTHRSRVQPSFTRVRSADSARPRKKSAESQPISSSASSDDDKITSPVEASPFTFDSLQKIAEHKDSNNNRTSLAVDQLYPSIDVTAHAPKNDEDDDDLLLAAAAACTNIQAK